MTDDDEVWITMPNIKRGSISIEKCIWCVGTVVTHRTKEGEIESMKHTPPTVVVEVEYETTFYEKIKNLFKRITRVGV